jgi:HK97 family phage major capsid protein
MTITELNELAQKRAGLIGQGRAILDKADHEKRSPTAEEDNQYKTIYTDAAAIQARIDTERKQQALEVDLRTPVPTVVGGKDDPGKRDGQPENTEARAAFTKFLRSGHLLETEARALTQSSEPDGGYFVPDQFRAELIQGANNLVFVRQFAAKSTIAGTSTVIFPKKTARMTNAEWTSEVGKATKDTALKFGLVKLTPNKLQKAVQISTTLQRNSAIDIDAVVREELDYVLAITMEQAYLLGTGSAQPLGVFTVAADGINIDRDFSDGNTATAITIDGLKNALYHLTPIHRKVARWLFSMEAVLGISKMKDGEGRYIWQTSIVAGDPDILLGHGVDESAYVPNTFQASQYVGMLADWNQGYRIVDSQGIELQILRELYAEEGMVEMLMTMWSDGKPTQPEAFARIKLAAS